MCRVELAGALYTGDQLPPAWMRALQSLARGGATGVLIGSVVVPPGCIPTSNDSRLATRLREPRSESTLCANAVPLAARRNRSSTLLCEGRLILLSRCFFSLLIRFVDRVGLWINEHIIIIPPGKALCLISPRYGVPHEAKPASDPGSFATDKDGNGVVPTPRKVASARRGLPRTRLQVRKDSIG